ncbi:MAG TPA: mucoidy inhibitor MuiA family protein, partial [Anaeromyxobacteraceae bacterium]
MRPLAALAAVALVTPLLAHAAPEVEAASRIDAVTVFRSSARVVRVLRVEVGAGASRVALPGLPAELDDDSIRVEGRGGGRVEIHGVTVERVRRERAVASEARAAEERLEGLQDEDRALQDRVKAAQGRSAFVESLRSTYSEERSRNLAVRPLSAKEWAEAASFVERQLADAAGAVRQAEAARRELRRRIEQARAALDQLAAKRGETTKRVAIEVTAPRPGAIELAVTYTVPSAGWAPV